MSDDYENMTVAELKELLKEQGLPVSGKKADLIERLVGAAEQDDAPVEETEAVSDVEESDDDFFEDDDDWDDDEDEGHVAKQKPVLDEATQEALALRAALHSANVTDEGRPVLPTALCTRRECGFAIR